MRVSVLSSSSWFLLHASTTNVSKLPTIPTTQIVGTNVDLMHSRSHVVPSASAFQLSALLSLRSMLDTLKKPSRSSSAASKLLTLCSPARHWSSRIVDETSDTISRPRDLNLPKQRLVKEQPSKTNADAGADPREGHRRHVPPQFPK